MKRSHMALLAAALLIAVAFFYSTNPLRHAKTFVSLYADQIEDSLNAGEGIPPDLGCLDTNLWEGDHPMAEMVLSGWGIGSGTRYYGCYYSRNDVPLPFQKADVELVPKGADIWIWTAEGDNHGTTQKIKDNWYYFEASF